MGIFDDMFGGLFDFNGDGETDMMEGMMGFHILNEMEKRNHYDDDDDDDEED